MTFGSLFAGIGGFDLGLERAGMECRWQVENDEYATKVLEKHWPEVKRYGDIREVRELEWVDLICGGFPCQDISLAGRGAGIEGERSGLWSEFDRIIRLVRPRFVLVENVPALLGRGLWRVLGDLAESGYDAEWDCIPAAAIGAPHLRDRIWIVAYASRHILRDELGRVCRESGPGTAKPVNDGEARELADTGRELLEGRCSESTARSTQWEVEPDVGRVAHGVPARVDRLRCLGNAIVPQVAEWIGRRIMESALVKYEEKIRFADADIAIALYWSTLNELMAAGTGFDDAARME